MSGYRVELTADGERALRLLEEGSLRASDHGIGTDAARRAQTEGTRIVLSGLAALVTLVKLGRSDQLAEVLDRLDRDALLLVAGEAVEQFAMATVPPPDQ